MSRAVARRGAVLLATLVVTGCGAASTSRSSWLYIGSDETLATSPGTLPPELQREMAADRSAGTPSPTLQAKLREAFENRQRRVRATIDEARGACIRQTGDSGERHFWTGYDAGFLACMKARGWSRPTGTDPL